MQSSLADSCSKTAGPGTKYFAPSLDSTDKSAWIQQALRVEFVFDASHDLQRRRFVSPDIKTILDFRSDFFNYHVTAGGDAVGPESQKGLGARLRDPGQRWVPIDTVRK